MPAHRSNISGERFFAWTVLSFAEMRKGRAFWLCRCDCGAEKIIAASNLKRGMPRSCGCLNRDNLSGQRFFRWTAIRFSPSSDGKSYWLCRCDCGVERDVATATLKNGSSKSCGCWKEEVNRKNGQKTWLRNLGPHRGITRAHGESRRGYGRTAEYSVWVSMHERCRDKRRKDYGARGITVCPRWGNYETFLADMGRKPTPQHSIDRIDVNKGYSPDNCRWATKKEQVDNRRKFGLISIFTDAELEREWIRREPFIPLSLPI